MSSSQRMGQKTVAERGVPPGNRKAGKPVGNRQPATSQTGGGTEEITKGRQDA
jgi:hypothetical protein